MRIRGLVRALDPQGRIVVPREMLIPLGIAVGDPVEIMGGQDPEGMPALVIRKYFPGCVLCGEILHNTSDYIEPHGKPLCKGCLREITIRLNS